MPAICGWLCTYQFFEQGMNKEVTKMSLVPYVIEQTNRGERSYDI